MPAYFHYAQIVATKCGSGGTAQAEASPREVPLFASLRRLRPLNKDITAGIFPLYTNRCDKLRVRRNRAGRSLRHAEARLSRALRRLQPAERPNSGKLASVLAYSYFGFALDTPARQNASKLAFALAYSYFGFALDTPARQNASKLAFALAYSYLCKTEE